VLVDSLVLRNPPERKARKRQSVYQPSVDNFIHVKDIPSVAFS